MAQKPNIFTIRLFPESLSSPARQYLDWNSPWVCKEPIECAHELGFGRERACDESTSLSPLLNHYKMVFKAKGISVEYCIPTQPPDAKYLVEG